MSIQDNQCMSIQDNQCMSIQDNQCMSIQFQTNHFSQQDSCIRSHEMRKLLYCSSETYTEIAGNLEHAIISTVKDQLS